MVSSSVISFNFVVCCYQISIITSDCSVLSLTFEIEMVFFLLYLRPFSDHIWPPSGKWLGSRQIRCNWATKGAGSNEDKQSSDVKSIAELTNGSSGECSYPIVKSLECLTFVVMFTPRINPLNFWQYLHQFDISAEDGKETVNSDAPENNPQYTTVYVGNLAPEARYLILICVFSPIFLKKVYVDTCKNWASCMTYHVYCVIVSWAQVKAAI